MEELRRDFLRFTSLGIAAGATTLIPGSVQGKNPGKAARPGEKTPAFFDVRTYGAAGDGKTIDSTAINAAIDAAASAGGGTVVIPAGVYASYSIHLKSLVALYLQQGATILAAPTPYEGMSYGGYDAAEPQGAWEPYQDYGHNHWHNSLIWAEGMHDFGIFGPGLIWGKGLSRGHNSEKTLPDTTKPGVANKAIALKNCRNVILSDFSILQGGWFGLLATGVDNLTIDNLKIDTNRDGIDLDCCRNARVSNCTVNSPWDDGICPKSSFALGYARATENVTISNCYLTGDYQLGSVLDGTWKRMEPSLGRESTGRIKCGTESNGGFKNITISNCVFESCRGIALETVDGALCEDITIVGVTMRDVRQAPFFLRLGARMRGPQGAVVGTLKRILISNITCSGADLLPSIVSGIPGHMVEDIKISDIYLRQAGGGSSELASRQPPEYEDHYPEPTMFGELPASGLFVRNVRNLELSNVEISTETPDARPAFWLKNVNGADFFRLKTPRNSRGPVFRLQQVEDFRSFGCKYLADASFASSDQRDI
jgi:polygalacturonase